MSSNPLRTASLLGIAIIATGAPLSGQSQDINTFRRQTAKAVTATADAEKPGNGRVAQADSDLHFKSRKDSVDWFKARALANRSTGFRVIVSLQDRHVWVVSDEDTLLSAPAAVARGTTLNYSGNTYTFDTPRGQRVVLNKDSNPIWNPPNWLYDETAKEYGLKVAYIPSNGTIKASDGSRIGVQDNRVGIFDSDGFREFPTTMHVIIGETLYVPPIGTDNRRVSGTLGKYKLNLGDGYMLHGTPDQNSIGLAATHGCVRLRDEDIQWLYENVPVGTKVYIY